MLRPHEFAATFLCAVGLSRLVVKNGRFAEQSFEARVTAWRSVEGSDENFPTFCVEREHAPIRQPFLGFSQRRFENELADGLTRRRSSSLQRLLGGLAEPQIEFFGSVCALSSHFYNLNKPSDNVKTSCLGLFSTRSPRRTRRARRFCRACPGC